VGAEPGVTVPERPRTSVVAEAPPPQFGATLALIFLLPLYFQVFQYLADLPLLWTFAKVSPLLLAPLVLLGLLRLRLPHTGLTFLVLLYVLLAAPILSMLQLQNDLVEGLGSTVKVWSLTFYFAAVASLVAFRVTEATLTRVLLGFALSSFVLLWVLWVTVPASMYGLKPAGQTIFLWDQEREERLLLPFAFGLIGVFWLARRFAQRPAVWPVLLIILAFVLMFTILKYRTVIAATALIVLWGMSEGFRRRAPTLFWGLVLGGGALGAAALLILSSLVVGTVQESLGGSLLVRQNSTKVLLQFLGEDPIRWVFGVGGTTEISRIGITDILRTRDFFFADLGWLGLIGEYGVIGSLLLLLLHLAALLETRRAAKLSPTPMRQALQDFVVYVLATSVVLSLVLTPGQIVTVLAIAVWMQRAASPDLPDGGQRQAQSRLKSAVPEPGERRAIA